MDSCKERTTAYPLNKYIAFHDSSNKIINACIRLLYYFMMYYITRGSQKVTSPIFNLLTFFSYVNNHYIGEVLPYSLFSHSMNGFGISNSHGRISLPVTCVVKCVNAQRLCHMKVA